jgi:hypothetical protein
MLSINTSFIFFFVISSNSIVAQKQPAINDWIYFNLKGKVKSLDIKKFAAGISPGGTINKGAFIESLTGTLINKGDMQDSLVFNASGQLKESYYFPYFHRDTALVTKKTYEYNLNGDLEKQVSFRKYQNLVSSRTEKIIYDSNGIKYKVLEYYNNADTASAWWLFSAEKERSRIDAAMYIKNYGKRKNYTYEFDPLGRIVTVISCDADSGNLSTYKVPANERFEIIRNKVPKVKAAQFYQYKFDAKGNWIEMILFKSGRPVYMISRDIVYY